MFRAEDWTHMLTAKVALPPGLYQIKFCPLTVLPPPKKDAPLLMSDIDGIPRAHRLSRATVSPYKSMVHPYDAWVHPYDAWAIFVVYESLFLSDTSVLAIPLSS